MHEHRHHHDRPGTPRARGEPVQSGDMPRDCFGDIDGNRGVPDTRTPGRNGERVATRPLDARVRPTGARGSG